MKAYTCKSHRESEGKKAQEKHIRGRCAVVALETRRSPPGPALEAEGLIHSPGMLGLPAPPPFPAPLKGQVGEAAVEAPAGAGVLYQGHCSPWAAQDAHEKQPAWPSVLLLFLNSPQAMGPLPHLIACTWGGAGPPPKPPLPCLGPNHWGPFAIRGLKLATPLS